MTIDQELQALLDYKAEHLVLSVYLNTDPSEGNADTFKLQLRSMLKGVDLPDDVENVLRYFDHEHDWSGRSVAVFSCAQEDFFKVFKFSVPVRNRVRVNERPYVKPLANLFDAYGEYGIVLIDSQEMRLFYFNLGEMQEEESWKGESIRRTKRGGGSQSPGRRGGTAGQTDYTDALIERNMKKAVEIAEQFFTRRKVRRIIIGGTEENVSLFRSRLPKAWQSLVVGTFNIGMDATNHDVITKAISIGEAYDRRRETKLSEAILTAAAKGKGGAVGLHDTLEAVYDGKVQTLLLRDGTRAAGYRCKSCGYISAEEVDSCPYCGGEMEQIPDVVDLIVAKILGDGGDVEILDKGQPPQELETVGALLRY